MQQNKHPIKDLLGVDLLNKAGRTTAGLLGGNNFLKNLSQSFIDTIVKVCSPNSARTNSQAGNTTGQDRFAQVNAAAIAPSTVTQDIDTTLDQAALFGGTVVAYMGVQVIKSGILIGAAGGMATANGDEKAKDKELPKQEGRGQSKGGKHKQETLEEELAMEEAMTNPEKGKELKGKNTDPRWPEDEGWEKRTQNINGEEVHYQYNPKTGAIDDVKLK